jgi:hypothetical protein
MLITYVAYSPADDIPPTRTKPARHRKMVADGSTEVDILASDSDELADKMIRDALESAVNEHDGISDMQIRVLGWKPGDRVDEPSISHCWDAPEK